MGKRQIPVRRILWWAFLILFLGSGIWLAYYAYSAITGEQAIQEMTNELAALRAQPLAVATLPTTMPTADERATVASAILPVEQSIAPSQPDATPNAATHVAVPTEDPILAYYRAHAKRNPDMVGWVHLDQTMIDYPVMYTPYNPQKYLHMDFRKQYSFAGLPFVDARCDLTSLTQNRIVYAHNMRSGQMFAQLLKYLDAEYLRAHPVIQFDTLDAHGDYEVFAVLQVNLSAMNAPNMFCYSLFDTAEPKEVDALNAYLKAYAHTLIADAALDDSILTLSTCQHLGSVDRLVVMARKAAVPKP